MDKKVFAAGALRIKSMLPDGVRENYDTTQVLNKDGVKNLIASIITHGGSKAPESISNVSKLFFDTATNEGYSTPLSDYINDSDERDALVKEFQSQVDMINDNSKLTEREKAEMLGDVTTKYQKKMVTQNMDYMISKGSTAAVMAQTGARGNPSQLQQATSTPMMAKGIGGKPIPLAITRSFAQGLTPAEHMAMSHWGRSNTVSAQLATSEPGAMFKRIAPNTFSDVVTVHDCGTTNGIVYPISRKNRIIGHFEAGTNHMIDEAYFNDLYNSGKKDVKVRSVLTCEAHEGVCQKCYGRNPDGKVVNIGDNIGILAAQSTSEKLTQMILSTKHDAKAGKGRNPFYEAKNLVDNPASFQDKATIATLSGRVDKVAESSLGDNRVFINGIEHFIPNIQSVKVKEGDEVKQGDKLSTGTIDPKELVALRGLGAGRRYVSDKLEKIYDGSLDPRHYDVISRNLIKYVEVNDPGETGFLPGQKVNVMKIHDAMKKDCIEVPVDEALGKVLAVQVLEIHPGATLDKIMIDDLKAKGIETVKITKSGLRVTPFVPGATTLKSFDPNWVSRLAHKGLRTALEEGAIMGHEAPIHGTDPITPYIIGSTFGEGKNGKY